MTCKQPPAVAFAMASFVVSACAGDAAPNDTTTGSAGTGGTGTGAGKLSDWSDWTTPTLN